MSTAKPPLPPTEIPALNDPQTDGFQKFATDPRLDKRISKHKTENPSSAWQDELSTRLKPLTDQQEILGEINIFKREKFAEIEKLESDPFANRATILDRITAVAETIIKNTCAKIAIQMRAAHGLPTFRNAFLQTEPSELAIIGLSSLGGRVLNYASVPEIAFVYSHLGETIGKAPISNQEYFTRFAQKWMAGLAIQTETKAKTDSSLPKTDNSSPFVSAFDHFLSHQMNPGKGCERLAVLRTRPFEGPTEFVKKISDHLWQIALKRPVEPTFYAQVNAQRARRLATHKSENEQGLHLLWAPGMLMDLDLVLQGLQLKLQPLYPDLRTTNPFSFLTALKTHSVLETADVIVLEDALIFYHTLIAQIHLQKKSADYFWDWEAKSNPQIATAINLTPRTIREKIQSLRNSIQTLYKKTYESP